MPFTGVKHNRVEKPLDGTIILLVDDNVDQLNGMGAFFENYGAVVVKAESARGALALLVDRKQCKCPPPTLIFTDMSMPEETGLWFAEQLRDNLQYVSFSRVPLVFLSAYAPTTDNYEERAIALGAARYLTKPITPDKLIEVMLLLEDEVPQFAKLRDI